MCREGKARVGGGYRCAGKRWFEVTMIKEELELRECAPGCVWMTERVLCTLNRPPMIERITMAKTEMTMLGTQLLAVRSSSTLARKSGVRDRQRPDRSAASLAPSGVEWLTMSMR